MGGRVGTVGLTFVYVNNVGDYGWSEGRSGSSPTLEGLESRVARPPLLQWGSVGGRVGVAIALLLSNG